MGRLDEKVAIVSGAGQGVGRGIALALASEGASVVLAELRPETGRAVEREIQRRGGRARFVGCDVARRESIEACVQRSLDTYGRIDTLVNNAISPSSPLPLLEQDEAAFQDAFQSGLLGTVNFMQCCHPSLRERRGSIVNLGSAAGYQGHAELAAYAATKEAIRTVTRVAAREWGADGIRVNCVCPFANSPGWEKWTLEAPEAAQGFIEQRPLPRIGDCETDVGRTVAFLASEDAAYLTGATLPVDGGGAMLG